MSAYTPGPWKRTSDGPFVYALGTDARNRVVNRMYLRVNPGWAKGGEPTSEAEQNATADLIAAAPDLYEALLDALREADECRPRRSPEAGIIPRPHFMWRERARAALAKAESRAAPDLRSAHDTQFDQLAADLLCSLHGKQMDPGWIADAKEARWVASFLSACRDLWLKDPAAQPPSSASASLAGHEQDKEET